MADLTRINTLLGFLKDDPDDTFVIFAIAKEYEKQKLAKKALETFHRLREKDRNYVGLYYHLGKLNETLSDMDEALAVYKDGIEVAKRIADFHALSELHTAKVNLEIELADL